MLETDHQPMRQCRCDNCQGRKKGAQGSMSINEYFFARILLPIVGQMRKQLKENFAMCVGKKCMRFLASDVKVGFIDIAVISA